MGINTSVQPVPAALRQITDAAVRDISQKVAHTELTESTVEPFKTDGVRSLITVTQGDYELTFVFSAASSVLAAFARNMRHGQMPDAGGVETCACEFLNILCGRIVSQLNRRLHVSARFGVPQVVDGFFSYKTRRETDTHYEFCYRCRYGLILVRTLFRWNAECRSKSAETAF